MAMDNNEDIEITVFLKDEIFGSGRPKAPAGPGIRFFP
jgi:hypothetical protein